MKINKYTYIFAAALMACSCNSNEIIDGVEPDTKEPSMFAGTITDDLEVLDTEGLDGEDVVRTRSVISDNQFSSWSIGDKVSISDGTLFFQYKVSSIGTPTTSCSFEIGVGSNAFENKDKLADNYYVFYPADAVKDWFDGAVDAMIYAEQDCQENKDGGVMGSYMASKATISTVDGKKDVHFSFKHCSSIIEVDLSKLTTVTPKSVSIKANSGVSLAGQFDYDINSSTFSLYTDDATGYSDDSRSDVVTVGNINGASVVRFYVLPVLLEGGVTVTVMDTDGQFYTKSTTGTIGNEYTESSSTNISVENSTKSGRVCRPYYKKLNFGAITDATKRYDWMSTIPSNTYFSCLSTPGSHNSAANKVERWNFGSTLTRNMSRCQTVDIDKQLTYGIRAFDYRPTFAGYSASDMTYDNLEIYHGATRCHVLFKDAMQYLVDYVKAHPTEAITMMFNKTDARWSGASMFDYTSEMWVTLNQCFENHKDYIYEPGFTEKLTLGDIRGKIIIINRTGTNAAHTTRIIGWPNDDMNVKYGLTLGKCTVSMEDHYGDGEDLPEFAEKQGYISQIFQLSTKNHDPSKYTFNFSNIAYGRMKSRTLPYSLNALATKMNPLVIEEIGKITGPAGYVYSDYVCNDDQSGMKLVTTVMQQNFNYVYTNRSRLKRSSSSTNSGATTNGSEFADGSEVYVKGQR